MQITYLQFYKIFVDMNILGTLRLNFYLIAFMLIMIATPGYTYYMATYIQKSQKPFPHSSVTSTACHYPQDIAFRFNMLNATSFLGLLFFVIYRWINNKAQEVGYADRIPGWKLWLSQISIALYTVAIGTIDGVGIGKYHGPASVIFFITWFYIIIQFTIFLTKLHNYDSSIMSRGSLVIKQLLTCYILVVWAYCLYGIITTPSQQLDKKQSYKYIVILEWNSVNINILWMLTWVKQWKQFRLCLVSEQKQQLQHIQ